MADFNRWATDPRLQLPGLRQWTADPANIAKPYADEWIVWESSGTSGQPGIFVQDAQAMAVYDALESLRRSDPEPWRRWLNPLALGERWAFVGATGGHFATLVSLERIKRMHPVLGGAVQAFSILQPTAHLVAALNEHAPTIIATYPTVATLLADEAGAGRLRARPRELWTGGETLSPAMRAHVVRQLGCSVRNSYGASEFLPMAWECRAGRLHVNADWLILEPVDAKGRAVPAGSLSATTLLTNLANRLQPLIRYDLGDRIALAPQRCACGSPMPVVQVQGRLDDPLHMAGVHGHTVTLLPLALCTVLEDEAGIFDFELAQRDAHTLLLKLPLPEAEAHEALARGCKVLRRFAQRQGVQHPHVLGLADATLARGRSGKARRVQGLQHTLH
jgi:phenylacetate-coenzyme A ligase PaaK-like adenylate-forming protein